jgi:hypothetical protein
MIHRLARRPRRTTHAGTCRRFRVLVGLAVVALAVGGCQDETDAPHARIEPVSSTRLDFVDAATEMGLDFQHEPSRSGEKYMPEVLGGGVVLADFDRNGAPDLVFVDSGALEHDGPRPGSNRLFLNDGQGHFRDVTDAWQLPSPGYGMGAAAGDFDDDGWTDLYLTTFGSADVLLRNTGESFVDVTAQAGLEGDGRWSTSAGFLDHDLDGDLDLYVVSYVDYALESALRCYDHEVHVYCTPLIYAGVADRLLRNEGDGTFIDISRETGLQERAGKGLALAIGDIDEDGDPDVYIANDSTRNVLLINDGAGQFEDQALLRGVAYSGLGREEAGMGVDFADLDGDGTIDIVCTNFQGETTSIYCQNPDGSFSELSDALGVGGASRHRLSFGVDAFDADNDGDEDLLIANGHIDDLVATHRPGVDFEQRDTLYENVEPGRLVDVTEEAGSAFVDPLVGRGLVTGDLDGDGDLDFVIANNGGPARVGRNESRESGHWVTLWLEGRVANRSALGTRIVARVGSRTLKQQVLGASSYLSSTGARVHFGLGEAMRVDELIIDWPGSEPQVLRELAADQHYHVVEGEQPVVFRPGESR